MLNLFLDTTQDTLMVALATQDVIVERIHLPPESHRYHSAMLLPTIESALNATGNTPRDLTGVGVNVGPGSFTGIRTGLSVARLMGQFLAIPTYQFNTFELVAGHSGFTGQSVTVLLNAFRQQHYRAALRVDNAGNVRWLEDPHVQANTELVPIVTDICVMEDSLVGKLDPSHPNLQRLGELALFTPEVMKTYLHHHPNRHRVDWPLLLPLYLQLPHITQSKKKPVGG